MSIKLSRTKDILLALGNQRIEKGIQDQIICGFSMETRDLIENSRKKIDSKHIDLIAANNLKVAGRDLVLIPMFSLSLQGTVSVNFR